MDEELQNRMEEYKERCESITQEYCEGLLTIVVEFEDGGVGVYFGYAKYEESPRWQTGVVVYDITRPYDGVGDELEMNMTHLIFPGDGTMIITTRWGEGDDTTSETKKVGLVRAYPLGKTDIDLPVIQGHVREIHARHQRCLDEMTPKEDESS